MRVRPANEQDIEAIRAIWNAVIRDTAITFTTQEKSAQDLRAMLREAEAGQGHALLVAIDDGQVIGLACCAPFRGGPGYRRTLEHSVYLAPEARGRGAGRALMTALEQEAAAQGAHSLIAAVSAENPGGLSFHLALGFAEVGRIPEAGRKFDRWIDLILLQKILRDAAPARC